MSKVALITGSTSGIGWAVARRLATAGYNIVLHGIADADTIDQCTEQLERLGAQVLFDGADLADPKAIDKLMANIDQRFARLDVLVNNAGIQYTAPVETFPHETWQRIIDIMLTAPFILSGYAVERMRKNNWGRIINISSVHGLVGSANKAGYVAAKHGIVGLTKVCALENAGSGITVNAICPGWVNTPLIQPQFDKRAQEKGIDRAAAIRDVVGEKQPSQQFVEPEDIGAMIEFLLSENANQITGTTLAIDGGWSAQ